MALGGLVSCAVHDLVWEGTHYLTQVRQRHPRWTVDPWWFNDGFMVSTGGDGYIMVVDDGYIMAI